MKKVLSKIVAVSLLTGSLGVMMLPTSAQAFFHSRCCGCAPVVRTCCAPVVRYRCCAPVVRYRCCTPVVRHYCYTRVRTCCPSYGYGGSRYWGYGPRYYSGPSNYWGL